MYWIKQHENNIAFVTAGRRNSHITFSVSLLTFARNVTSRCWNFCLVIPSAISLKHAAHLHAEYCYKRKAPRGLASFKARAETLELAAVIHEGSYAGPGQNSIHFAHCSVVAIKIRSTCKRVTILNSCSPANAVRANDESSLSRDYSCWPDRNLEFAAGNRNAVGECEAIDLWISCRNLSYSISDFVHFVPSFSLSPSLQIL